ncbi:facilitated trehalose transporter Tret1-like [Atheta coriaria]|uniref:facilitated trehalose transporter Tret1-like n=1 Tax=Dalotia coriaria TaxID=877792 RepID=UPI0031F4519D
MPGAILGPFFLEFLGRKWSYVIIAMWNLINWTILSFSSATWHILLARTMQGLNEGMSYSLSTCFIVEVAPLQYRAKLLNTINVGVALGMLFVDIVGSFNSWRTSALILACLSLIDAIILLFMKNTHVWYLQRGRIDDAKMAYFWYRPQTNENTQILNQEIEIYTQEANISLNELSKEWLKREFLFPLLIMIWFTATMMTSGGYAIALYSVDVMSNVIALDGYTITIIIDVVRVAASISTIFLLEVSPIRWMINAGTFVCSISLLIRAASLYWEEVMLTCGPFVLGNYSRG